jgi:hypothetical protein
MVLRQRPGKGNPKDKDKGKNKKGKEVDSTQPRVMYVRPKGECVLVLYILFLCIVCVWA